MTQARRFRVVCLFLLLLVPVAGITSAMAQDQQFTPELYTSVLSSFDVEVSGPEYEITDATIESYTNGDGEIVSIDSEWASIEVSFFDDTDSPRETLDAYIAGLENADVDFALIDRGESAGVFFAIVSIEYEGIEILYYLQVTQDVTGNVDMLQSLLASGDTFEDDLAGAQDEIRVNGMPFMGSVDGAEVMELIVRGPANTATPAAIVQPNPMATSVPFENAGVDLQVGSGFTIVGEPNVDGDIHWYELAGDATETVVAVGQSGMLAEDVVGEYVGSLGDYYDAVNPIDSSTGTDNAWTLLEVGLEGEARVLLVVVDTAFLPGFEVLVSLEMPVGAVAASITAIQEGVSIDGNPLLAGIDPDDIAARMDGDTPLSPRGSGSDSARDEAKLPGSAGVSNSSEVNSTPEATEEPAGLSGSSWEGPVLGHLVEWDTATWFVDLDDNSLVESSAADEYESITLTARLSPALTLFYVSLYGGNNISPQEYLAYWTSDEFLQHETSSGETFTGELVDSRSSGEHSAVVIRYTNSDGDFYLIREAVRAEDGTLMLLTLDVPAGDVVPAYTAVQDGVTVDSTPLLTVFSVTQIERLAGE